MNAAPTRRVCAPAPSFLPPSSLALTRGALLFLHNPGQDIAGQGVGDSSGSRDQDLAKYVFQSASNPAGWHPLLPQLMGIASNSHAQLGAGPAQVGQELLVGGPQFAVCVHEHLVLRPDTIERRQGRFAPRQDFDGQGYALLEIRLPTT
jgi:hypothetical protein